jgi:tRNA A37 methylthiotransferase MiaB
MHKKLITQSYGTPDVSGEHVRVLIEDEEGQEGRAEHQGPEVDGSTFIKGRAKYKVGEYVDAVVTETSGVDLIAVPL